LHRTRAVSVTEQTLMFGFRAASISDPAQAGGLAAIAHFDLLKARRHAAVLAGYLLARDLAALRQGGNAAGCAVPSSDLLCGNAGHFGDPLFVIVLADGLPGSER
jgi:hypothetical protein